MHVTAPSPTTPRSRPSSAVRSKSNGADRLTLPRSPLPAALSLRRPPEPTRCRLMSPPTASISGAGGLFAELKTAADFAAIASPGSRISVVGFGSLLSERSARCTFPDLEGFRVAALRGFRLFQKDWMECYLQIRQLFVRATVTKNISKRCKGSKEIYSRHYGRYNIDKIWRDDILPCRLYLRHCVLAAKNLGEPAYNNFLDHTYLGSRKTTIREYLATTGAGIMEEEPPESLKTCYGG